MSDRCINKTSADVSSEIIRRFWIADVVVLVIFLSTAVYGIYLFRQDLMQTIEFRGASSVGYIVIKNNVVQRRYEDRAIWERLFVDSPVYSGDLVRAAEFSSATIFIAEHQINLNENTLIRIRYTAGEDRAFEVELREGNLSVALASGEDEDLMMLNIMGRQVQLASGTMLSAEISEEGLIVKVSEGSAVFVEGGQEREISEGMMLAQDKEGKERQLAAAVVISVKPNAYYLKSTPQPLSINFNWTSVNIEQTQTVRLEIASDKSFSKDFRVITGLYNHALAAFNAGVWHWRLSLDGLILSMGQITVADGSGPELESPADATVFRYFSALPQIRFQWSKKSGAVNYIVEICQNKDFIEPQVERQTMSVSFIQDGLESGTWYWRVLPVFPPIYQGSAGYSPAGSFKIEKTEDPHASAIEISETVLAAKTSAGSYYTVVSGDTLGRIAGRVYGDPFQWPRISEANKLENPDLILVDQVLFIP